MLYNTPMSKKKVVVGMSGGKDSTAACLLLREQGYDVHGLTMRLGLPNEDQRVEKVKHLADTLGIPFNSVDMRRAFQEKVVNYFLDSYAQSLTPNPCAVCNVEIKFNLLMNTALRTENSDYYATGHYAHKTDIDGRTFLTEPEDRGKSQIYFLSLIGGPALEKVLFPIADVSIDTVRHMVKDLPLGNTDESQDVCFIQDRKLVDFLKEHLPPKFFQPGDILDVEGKKIGRHKGAVYFTIGQRRGTGFSSDRKLYVVGKNTARNTITLGDEHHLYSHHVEVINPVFWRPVEVGEAFQGKFRYMSSFHRSVIREVSADRIVADFDEPVKSITPGQIAAFYQDDRIIAAGYIK